MSVTAGVALLVLAADRAGETLLATQPALLAVAAIVLLGAFAVREKMTPAPVLDLTTANKMRSPRGARCERP